MTTLFYSVDVYVEQFNKQYDHPISKEFAGCADAQLSAYFEQATGLKISKKVSIGWAFPEDFFIEVGIVSKFASKIWINHNTHNVTIAWKSKSGTIWRASDKNIDCADLEFWFEQLDPLLYHKQLYPNLTLPFNLKEVTYELTVNSLNVNLDIDLKLKANELENEKKLEGIINKFLEHYNGLSVSKDRKYGVIHNWKSGAVAGNIHLEIDMGSAGMRALKSLLQTLSDLNAFVSVVIS